MLFLYLIFGVIINSNAAEIIDNRLMDITNKKEKWTDVKIDEMPLLIDNEVKVASAYESELRSILKKTAINQVVQGKPLKPNQSYSIGVGSSPFMSGILSDEFDAQSLDEAEMDWKEIKTDLTDVVAFWNALNRKVTNVLDNYLSLDLSTNLVVGGNINETKNSANNTQHNEKKSLFNPVYQRDLNKKFETVSYQKSSSYSDQSNSDVDSDSVAGMADEKKVLSFIYLWEKYSQTIIIVVSVLVTLWLVITGLIKFLTWNSKGTY